MRNVLAGAGSLLFWGFIAVSSILLFPVALLIWLLTRPFVLRGNTLRINMAPDNRPGHVGSVQVEVVKRPPRTRRPPCLVLSWLLKTSRTWK